MIFDNLTVDEIQNCFTNFDKYLQNFEQKFVKYVDLGCKVVRLIGYSEEFLPHIQKQLTFVLRDNCEKFDATLILWKEDDMLQFSKKIAKFCPKIGMRIKLEQVFKKAKNIETFTDEEIYTLQIIDEHFSKIKPIISVEPIRGFFSANNYRTNTYYYGVKDLSPEEFIKEGHIFVQFFNNIIKTDTSNLAHGAVIGLNGNGICFCARGQRGKSTLSVLSMMKGFEYVSDDYLILHNDTNGKLLASPIYSIITLSPEMYNRLYDYMQGSQFVSNNARKDKYVFNISNFHDRFRMNYPIKICMFPEIVTDPEPSIRLCTKEEKGRAITNLIQSTLSQTQDLFDHKAIKKMYNMVKDFPFYKFNLCHNIDKNTEFLREFMNNLDNQPREILNDDKIFLDITFDIANLLDNETGTIYTMNKFATNVYENMLNGVLPNIISEELQKIPEMNPNIDNELKIFAHTLTDKGMYQPTLTLGAVPNLNLEFAIEDNYKLSMTEFLQDEYIELIKERNENELYVK